MKIINSPDISELSIKVTWDISNPLPQILLENESTGGNLGACSWAFVALSPSQTPIHDGDINTPDITGSWSTYTLGDSWPRPFNQIEWSGAPYSFYVVVKDSTGAVYTAPVQYTDICRPVGNTESSKNTYGLALSNVKVKCSEASVFFQDTTYHTYKGDNGTQVSSVLTVVYPIDETLNIPAKFVAAQYVTALVPISYSSKNYQFVQTVIYDYEIGDNSAVRIRYQTIQTFAVFCNVDLMPLVCEINKLLYQVETGDCSDVTDAMRKMNLIVGKFTLVMIGIEQPLTGVDVPALIDEIVAIGGFDCNCCTAPTGIIPTQASVIGSYNFLFNKLGGDVQGSFSTNGNNITLNISDVSYVVAIGNKSPNTISAFSVTPVVSGSGFLKTYFINIDGIQLATDILNIIKSDAGLITLFNSIVIQQSGNFDLIVDMGCIGSITDACDYEFTLTGIPNAPSNAILFQIKSSIDGNVKIVSYAFNLSTLSSLQSYLNTLGIGTFVVTDLGGGNVSITTSSNSYSLTGMVYTSTGLTKKFAGFASDCTGFVSKSANEVVQAIIDYLCGITDCEMVTCQDYVICSIDPVSKQKVLTTVAAGTKENVLIAQILDKGCDTVDYLLALSGLNCAGMQALFPNKPTLIMQNTDYLYGTKAGQCAGISPVEAATRMLQLGVYNAEFMAAFCAAVALCAGGFSCEPYTIFQVAAVDTSPSSNQMKLVITFTHPSAIKNTIRYARIDNTTTPVYTTITDVLPGASPYTISGLDDGQYFVGITPIYADGRACTEVSTTTPSCSGITAFNAIINGSGDIVISYSAESSVSKVQVVINYPSGGVSTTNHTNNGLDITITPPTDVTGDYFITMVPVCNLATGFKGQATSPVILTVNPPNNSVLNNNTSFTLAPISMIAYSFTEGKYITVFNQPTVASSGALSFYLADGSYNKAQITFPTGSVGNAYLISSSGTMIGDVISGQVVFNLAADTFVSSGGIQIVFIDPSPAV